MASRDAAPHPTVAIDVRGGAITINGVPVPYDGDGDRYAVAVHEVARRVATPLGRPVRAVATDEDGQTRLVIHPDGEASDVEPLQATPATPAPPAAPHQRSDPPADESDMASLTTIPGSQNDAPSEPHETGATTG